MNYVLAIDLKSRKTAFGGVLINYTATALETHAPGRENRFLRAK
jgi:hypothetical protein